jgi:RNA polymerase sigma-70 factor (ECF subfamily)
LLYDSLLRYEPTPIVALNRASALAENGDLAVALKELEQLAEQLKTYQPFHAALGEYLARDGQFSRARAAYGTAISLTGNAADESFLKTRLARLSH